MMASHRSSHPQQWWTCGWVTIIIVIEFTFSTPLIWLSQISHSSWDASHVGWLALLGATDDIFYPSICPNQYWHVAQVRDKFCMCMLLVHWLTGHPLGDNHRDRFNGCGWLSIIYLSRFRFDINQTWIIDKDRLRRWLNWVWGTQSAT